MRVVVATPMVMKEIFDGDDLSVTRIEGEVTPILVVKEGEETLGEFLSWAHWVIQGKKDDLSSALREIMNLVTSENPDAEKLHFIGEALHSVGLLSKEDIPPKV